MCKRHSLRVDDITMHHGTTLNVSTHGHPLKLKINQRNSQKACGIDVGLDNILVTSIDQIFC